MSRTDDSGREYVTVDSGERSDVARGSRVVWLHVPRGGYGYTLSIPAEVVAIHPTTGWVTISAQRQAGGCVKRVVRVSSLRHPPEGAR